MGEFPFPASPCCFILSWAMGLLTLSRAIKVD